MSVSAVPALQLVLAGLSWSRRRSPTACSSLSYGVSSGGAGLRLTLGAWEQLEPPGKVFPPLRGNGQHWDSASQGLCFHESSQPGAQRGGRAAVPAPPEHSHLPSPPSAAFHDDHKHFQKRKSPSKWPRRAGGVGQLLPAGAHLGPWVQ